MTLHVAASAPMLFYEEFRPADAAASGFDAELDEIVGRAALERKQLRGFDNVAGCDSCFDVHSDAFREDLFSQASGSRARHRTVTCALSIVLFGHPFATLPEIADRIRSEGLRLLLTEHNSPLFVGLNERLPSDLFTFSEYFGDEYRSGTFVEGVRHEDVTATSFPDEYFDIVITSDVLEHVPHALKAERELVRILRPGGTYVFTVPLDPFGSEDIILAELDASGATTFHGPPVYHGDPLRPEGILAYRIFSLTAMERRFQALGCTMQTFRFWSKRYGIIGADSWAHLVHKPGTAGRRS